MHGFGCATGETCCGSLCCAKGEECVNGVCASDACPVGKAILGEWETKFTEGSTKTEIKYEFDKGKVRVCVCCVIMMRSATC